MEKISILSNSVNFRGINNAYVRFPLTTFQVLWADLNTTQCNKVWRKVCYNPSRPLPPSLRVTPKTVHIKWSFHAFPLEWLQSKYIVSLKKAKKALRFGTISLSWFPSAGKQTCYYFFMQVLNTSTNSNISMVSQSETKSKWIGNGLLSKYQNCRPTQELHT